MNSLMSGWDYILFFARGDRLQGSERQFHVWGEESSSGTEFPPHSRRLWRRNHRHRIHALHLHHLPTAGIGRDHSWGGLGVKGHLKIHPNWEDAKKITGYIKNFFRNSGPHPPTKNNMFEWSNMPYKHIFCTFCIFAHLRFLCLSIPSWLLLALKSCAELSVLCCSVKLQVVQTWNRLEL